MFSSKNIESLDILGDRLSLEIGIGACDFVKSVIPYGANNKKSGTDERAWKKISEEEYNEKYSIFKRGTGVYDFPSLVATAKKGIEHGIGNCEVQSCIAFLYFLSRGITSVTRKYVERSANDDYNAIGHVFVEFQIDNHVVNTDPWDNGIAILQKNDKTDFRQPNIFNSHIPSRMSGQRDLSFSSCHTAPTDNIEKYCVNILVQAINQSNALTTEEKEKAINLLPATHRNNKPNAVSLITRTVALLDVDQTLINDNGMLNEILISNLAEKNVKDIYLFTNMSLSDIVEKTINPNSFSRIQVIDTLRDRGFTVHGVITPADPSYNKGLTAAFTDMYIPQYKRIDKDLTEKTIQNDAEFQKLNSEFRNHNAATKAMGENNRHQSSKGEMYKHFLKNRPKWVGSAIFFDDDQINLDDAILANAQMKPQEQILLTTVKVNKRFENSFSGEIENHQKKQQLLNALEARILRWDLNPFLRSDAPKKKILMSLRDKICHPVNKNRLFKDILNEWLTENSIHDHAKTNLGILHLHRNRFFSEIRPATDKTSTEQFVDNLALKFGGVRLA